MTFPRAGMDGILLLGGATASGKSEAAIALARAYDAEIVGADSRQVYDGMPIGTAAPSPEQRAAVPHHLVSFLDPYERYSAARFASDALAAIESIRSRGRRVIVAGGTGFYLRALAGGVEFAAQYDEALRERVAREARIHPVEALHAWLASLDARRARAIDSHDRYRIMRALEVRLGGAHTRERPLPTLASRGIPFAFCVLDVPIAAIDARIVARTDAMLASGFIDEAERIGLCAPAASAVGYPLAIAWTRGWSTNGEMRAGLARETRRYARRQRTWFRGERDARPVSADSLEAFARERLGWR
ncbi:MAG: tRNA (adenosine(37)-N6)-dimethylallyltransferase MiaA [Candidatus Tyrphobacter sp.]